MGLSPAFAEDSVKNRQWLAFLQREGIPGDLPPLGLVVARLKEFLMGALTAGGRRVAWLPAQGWQDQEAP